MSQNPTYKTGIKTLTDIQLRNGLPSYDILMDKIRVVRENARKISGLPLDGSFENLKYDNFFSILGGRGAGKTSILLTIHNKLNYYYDKANNDLGEFYLQHIKNIARTFITFRDGMASVRAWSDDNECLLRNYDGLHKIELWNYITRTSRPADSCSIYQLWRDGSGNARQCSQPVVAFRYSAQQSS